MARVTVEDVQQAVSGMLDCDGSALVFFETCRCRACDTSIGFSFRRSDDPQYSPCRCLWAGAVRSVTWHTVAEYFHMRDEQWARVNEFLTGTDERGRHDIDNQ